MEFDYVIVGAGSSGCVIANRLSANGRYSVALLEAGGKDTSPWIHIPVGYFRTMNNPKFDWQYTTQADSGLNGRALYWPRGKVLGGSSSINGLLYVRGQAQDYDHWRQLGNVGWGWDEVAPLFKRSEHWEGGVESDLRGKDGLLNVSETKLSRSVIDKWIEAAQAAGYPKNDDYNGENQEGVGYFQLTAKNGRRCSTAAAFLRPARQRKNLTIITHAHTEKLLIEAGNAKGVIAHIRGRKTTIRARREVILSAGAIGSPQILMLSGIGDGVALQAAGVSPKHHLPMVGQNLQDHLQIRPVFKTDLPTINIEISNIFKKALIALEYGLFGTGPMTMAASLGVAFLKTRPQLETPDIQFHLQPFSSGNIIDGPHSFSAFTASVCQLRPESRGHLALSSPHYQDHPKIHPNYLSTPLDQETAVAGVQIARKIARLEPLKAHILEELSPLSSIECADHAKMLDWVRSNAQTIYHPTSTCKMGTDSKNAVVDPQLKVHGLGNLRIADASIMPTITSGNTNAPCIMIAEKASDMILKETAA